MSTFLKKIRDLLGHKEPEQATVVKMTEMVQQELKAGFLAAIPRRPARIPVEVNTRSVYRSRAGEKLPKGDWVEHEYE